MSQVDWSDNVISLPSCQAVVALCIWIRSTHSTRERCASQLVTIVNTSEENVTSIHPFHLRKVWITARHNRQYSRSRRRREMHWSHNRQKERCSEVHHQQQIWSLINGAVHPPLDFNCEESLIRNWQLRWRHCPNPSAAWIFQNHGFNSSAGPGGNNVSWLLCTAELKSDWLYTHIVALKWIFNTIQTE